jgi:threonylcarbamoyladenosine tRNA methylthiotransferase MtaB
LRPTSVFVPTASFYTLGCKLNASETGTLARQFAQRGYERVEFYEPADVVLINTCSVTENADRKCRKVVQQALRQNPKAYVIVVGCYAQLKPAEIASIPGVAAVLGAAEKFSLFEHIPEFVSGQPARVHRSPVSTADTFVPTHALEDRTRAFLKIQDGCDYTCSFCTIPLARGASRSMSPEAVLAAARELTSQGAKEIVLSGINLGDYAANMPWSSSLLEVLRMLETAEGIAPRLRLSSVEPNLLSDEIIDLVAGSARFVPHFHVPLQSGSNANLGKMRRRYRRELYAERIAHIRRVMPDAGIGADVIVGFPGETEAEYLESYEFLVDLDVTYLHVFPYSERADTLAATMPGAVPLAVRAERSEHLRQLSHKKKHAFASRSVGTTRTVLWEETPKHGLMSGLTENYLRVLAPYDPLLVNELTPTLLQTVTPDAEMKGEVVVAELVHA